MPADGNGVNIVVVGGTAKSVGKTALICGILAALPGREWTAIKITSHAYHGDFATQQVDHDPSTDTGRFLLAGAKKALLLEAPADAQWPEFARKIRKYGTNLIVESNRIAEHLAPDVCLGVLGEISALEKPSFAGIRARADAFVARSGQEMTRQYLPETLLSPGAMFFQLAQMDQISDGMRDWLQDRLRIRLSPSRR